MSLPAIVIVMFSRPGEQFFAVPERRIVSPSQAASGQFVESSTHGSGLHATWTLDSPYFWVR